MIAKKFIWLSLSFLLCEYLQLHSHLNSKFVIHTFITKSPLDSLAKYKSTIHIMSALILPPPPPLPLTFLPRPTWPCLGCWSAAECCPTTPWVLSSPLPQHSCPILPGLVLGADLQQNVVHPRHECLILPPPPPPHTHTHSCPILPGLVLGADLQQNVIHPHYECSH